jgi:hypothetical protein
VSGIGTTEVEKLETPREIVGDVCWLAVKKGLETIIRIARTCANNVLLILAGKLATSDEKVGTVLSDGCTRAVAEPAEPNEEILLEFGSFLLAQLVVGDESDVNEAERFLEDRLNFIFENVGRGRSGLEVV